MGKYDLREHSDNELSTIVFNEEHLYRLRHSSNLFNVLDDYYLYTKDQGDILKQDIEDDYNENN